MNKVKEFNNKNQIFNFLVEFLNDIEKDTFNFECFMTIVYGSTEEFKKYNLKDINNDFKKICKFLDEYEKIIEVSNE